MSSPITFSGFNNIDFNTVLNALMAQASQPLTDLQNQQAALKSQVTTVGTLSDKLSALQSASDDLANAGSTSLFAATSSNSSAVSATATAGAVAGDHDITVLSLAKAQVTASTSVTPDPSTTVVASGGSLTIGGVSVAITQDSTLTDIANAINSTTGIGVHAAVIHTGANAYRLTLTSLSTGAANGFTVTNQLTGGSGLTFADTDGNGISGDSAADNAVSASDASVLVDNIPVTSSSNTFSDVIPGLQFTVAVKDPTTPVHVSVQSDSSAVSDKVQAFVSAYNDLSQFISDQRTAAVNGDTSSIGNEPVVRQLQNALRTSLLGTYGAGTYTHLAEVGLGYTQTGTLQFDSDAFSQALATDPTAIANLVSGASGAFATASATLDEYSQGAGFVATVKTGLNDQITRMGDQIDQMTARLALQRSALQAEFTQADLVMSTLQSQSSSLASLGSNLAALPSSNSSSAN